MPTASPAAPCGPSCVRGPATFVTYGPRDSRSVALTFDDGFNVPACISIVATLIARDAAATFFPNGQYVRERPGFWHWVAANGFPVGSHATTHHDATTLSTSQLVLDLGSERRILDESLGVPSIDAFRPPFGSYDSRVLDVAGAAGYPLMVGWDVDSKDQDGARDVNEVIANAAMPTSSAKLLRLYRAIATSPAMTSTTAVPIRAKSDCDQPSPTTMFPVPMNARRIVRLSGSLAPPENRGPSG